MGIQNRQAVARDRLELSKIVFESKVHSGPQYLIKRRRSKRSSGRASSLNHQYLESFFTQI
jgi:hypothetical protein